MRCAARRPVFLDRDGVLNVERSYVTAPEQLEPVPKLTQALRRLGEAGFLRIVVSNQAAVARGLLDFQGLARIHQRLRNACEEELDAILACPHHPEVGETALTRECPCRKPGDAMLRHAQRAFDLDAARCFLVGDAVRDIEAAHRFGARAALVLGSKLQEPADWPMERAAPERFVHDLHEAVEWILTEGN